MSDVNTYRVTHVTDYKYSDDVSVSYGRAHLLPRSMPGQVVLASEIEVEPGADELRNHVDFYGNASTYYTVRRPHRELRITAVSDVQVTRPVPAVTELDQLSWESVRDALIHDVDSREFVLPSPLVSESGAVREFAGRTFTPGRPLGAALLDLIGRIHDEFEYVAGSTTVKTTLDEFLTGHQGVCQDFAHLAAGCLRSVGLPARYVSGYLETFPPPGQPKLQGVDASHAWTSVLLPTLEWIDIDPTNNQFVDSRYVVAGWGRDYSDVPPLKGVILTHAKKSTMSVSVDVARVA
jgi:transglutaminase-like putative cysteine protease